MNKQFEDKVILIFKGFIHCKMISIELGENSQIYKVIEEALRLTFYSPNRELYVLIDNNQIISHYYKNIKYE